MEELCQCPYLQVAAATERMAGQGIIPADGPTVTSHRINAILVGQLRQEHGCPGTRFNTCRYYYTTMSSDLITDPNVPVLKRNIDDGQAKKYI